MTPDPDLLRACLAAPLDSAPRLILADWLEERGWGTAMALAVLRWDGGRWLITRQGRKTKLAWMFDPISFLSGNDVLDVSSVEDDYGNTPTGFIWFGAVDGMPQCACGRKTDIFPGKEGWACGCGRRKRRPASIRDQVDAMQESLAVFLMNGVTVPESDVRAALGLPEPVEG